MASLYVTLIIVSSILIGVGALILGFFADCSGGESLDSSLVSLGYNPISYAISKATSDGDSRNAAVRCYEYHTLRKIGIALVIVGCISFAALQASCTCASKLL